MITAELQQAILSATSSDARSLRQFAEDEIWLPRSGPYGGLRFRVDRQPFTGLLFDELENSQWNECVIAGPSQSSKTLCAFCIPILWVAVERGENEVIGIPEADMADDKWRVDILPVMEASPYLRQFIPRRGSGSKGGKLKDSLELGYAHVKVITRGGKDTGKAGYTARWCKLTEAAGWSSSSLTSSEADNYRQLLARLRGFAKADTHTTIEGTLTTEDELPWRLRGSDENDDIVSTRSELLTPCPHCGEWVLPGRNDFYGWQEAKTIIEAEDGAHYLCPRCNHRLTEEDRRASNREVRLVHHGQHVDQHGEVCGPVPEVRRLWFHWSQWHNLLKPSSDHAVEEWEARRADEGSEDRDNAEKALCQFCWSIPYEPNYDEDNIRLDTHRMRKRRASWPASIVPPDTAKMGIGIDVGKYRCWYVALAGKEDYGIHCPAYGPITVMSEKTDDDDEVDAAILAALRDFRDNVIEPGWQVDGSDALYVPDQVWIDGNWNTGVVVTFVRESNSLAGCERYMLCRGRGKTAMGGYTHPSRKTSTVRFIGTYPYYLQRNYERRITEATFDADSAKLWFQQRWITKPDSAGALSLYHSTDKNEHGQFATHIANEQFVPVAKPRGVVKEWVKKGQNHLLDSGAMAGLALIHAGFDLREMAGLTVDDENTTEWWGNA
jgi:hypothetical protein